MTDKIAEKPQEGLKQPGKALAGKRPIDYGDWAQESSADALIRGQKCYPGNFSLPPLAGRSDLQGCLREVRKEGVREMKGLSFSEPMVNAWLAGNKTVTRRMMKPQPKMYGSGCWYPDDHCWLRSKHYSCDNHFKKGVAADFARYKVGETVYIAEKWAIHADDERELTNFTHGALIFYGAEGDENPHINRWRSPSVMPEWAARSHALIVSVRPERLQEINYEELKREGVLPENCCGGELAVLLARHWIPLWESLHPGSWERNDWVWRIELRKEANHEPT